VSASSAAGVGLVEVVRGAWLDPASIGVYRPRSHFTTNTTLRYFTIDAQGSSSGATTVETCIGQAQNFLPQVLKAWKTRSTRDISLGMFSMFCTGVFLWIIYGFLVGEIPVIAANVFTFIFAATIFVLKLKYQ
jgi:MtN3 and saliva related transmembrane protein